MRNLLKVLAVLIIVILGVGYFFFLYSDKQKLEAVRQTLVNIEDYYTEHGYYPPMSEIGKIETTQVDYTAYGENPNGYVFEYKLQWNHSYAIGHPTQGIFGSVPGAYGVTECDRWKSFGIQAPQASSAYYYKPGTYFDGGIESDLQNGQVVFDYGGNSVPPSLRDKKIVLLTGLTKPRVLSAGADINSVYITDGSEIYKYKIQAEGQTMKLVEKQKIGNLLTQCYEWK